MTGFVGRAIVENLSKSSHEVFGIGNKTKTEKIEIVAGDSSKKEIKVFKVDIAESVETDAFGREIKDIQVIVHSAGLAHQFERVSKEAFWKVNVDGTRNVLQLAKKTNVEQFILISSVAVYGQQKAGANKESDRRPAEERECRPNGFYAESKRKAEKIAEDFCRRNKINLTILRLATVVGEEDRGNFRRLIASLDKRRFIWIGRGENRKSLVHRQDVARACAKIIEQKKNASPSIYNISASPLTMKEIVKTVESGLKKNAPPVRIAPRVVEFICRLNAKTLRLKKISNFRETAEKWLSDDVYAAEKFEKDYDFEFTVSARQAIRRGVDWYKKTES